MKKPSKYRQKNVQPLELITFIVSALYFQSVLTVAHHTAFKQFIDGAGTVENPAVPLLIVGILLVTYNFKKEGRMGLLNTISFTILITSSIFWLSGLRANFFF